MNFGLTEEQQMIVDTTRSFVENEIYPHEDEVERTGEVPSHIAEAIMAKTKELGFYACNFPDLLAGRGSLILNLRLLSVNWGAALWL